MQKLFFKLVADIRKTTDPIIVSGEPIEISAENIQLSYLKQNSTAYYNNTIWSNKDSGQIKLPINMSSMLEQLSNDSGINSTVFTQEV